MFKPRLTKPEAGNPYYNRTASGGYSGAIKGHPTDPGCDVLHNCVGYAAGRFNEIIGAGKFVYFQHPPNAEDFYDTGIAAGLPISQKPQLGAIACWAKGKTHTGTDGAGHVAVVEEIKSDGSIITSESGYGAKKPVLDTAQVPRKRQLGAILCISFSGIYLSADCAEQSITRHPQRRHRRGSGADAGTAARAGLYAQE